ncbi:hypothetical protein MMC24_001339 [Lignoscripta atroalba]|nr:hypothetical protein [Lignoscripta atroalba]
MASVFTYDPNPPRVSSPWLTPSIPTPLNEPVDNEHRLGPVKAPQPALLADCGITKLEAEPQEGPTEYKLHLLLRPRRSFSASSTVQRVSGSHQSKPKSPRLASTAVPRPDRCSPVPAPTLQSRQNRLQHLTTQLLWRLQQSSPYHSSSNADLVVPVLQEAGLVLESPSKPGRLLPGLEESRGALYEIGVSDDGTFVGLAEDEMEESLTNLRIMAYSLGCKVDVLRTVVVGDCEWTEEPDPNVKVSEVVHTGKLLVAEALVLPEIKISEHNEGDISKNTAGSGSARPDANVVGAESLQSQTEQLRVSLTGSTTSGKSSLLGTLSTSTLDNGRGKSRLSLLKHRHEIASGITSSVAPELIGYRENQKTSCIDVINYGSGNVSSWIDIHSTAKDGRLVFLADSAGHPRYRRTTVRGLVSWAPHWTLCCVAGDEDENSAGRVGATASAREVLGSAGASIDLSKAHLELCLKLKLPLIVVITKLDLASKFGLRRTLTKILSLVKSAGRQPLILSGGSPPSPRLHLQSLARSDEVDMQYMLAQLEDNAPGLVVPIVLTSAVTGSGINRVHALLRHLPIPQPAFPVADSFDALDPENSVPKTLFHVDEVFAVPEGNLLSEVDITDTGNQSLSIVSGHLHYGNMSIGDEIYLGPFLLEVNGEYSAQLEISKTSSYPSPFKGNFQSTAFVQDRQRPLSDDRMDTPVRNHSRSLKEWQKVRVVSIRNLRLPVRTLHAGQVGTIGISFPGHDTVASVPEFVFRAKVRKGMVLAQPVNDDTLTAYNGFSALFIDEAAMSMGPGALVIVYIASIRASAKIIDVQRIQETLNDKVATSESPENIFDFDESSSDDGGVELPQKISIYKPIKATFQFVTYREWVETGTQVLVMPGSQSSPSNGNERGEKGSAGWDGFAGRITQVIA